ncbi:D-alanyl-D-alanine carboxypeptidase [Vineibacter terrae]|uniref:D-alanyl-D-alanine carboxypeptidase n=1 Tax=Vineibacter terrae TaxID=2586908 RepID=UPI002E36127A|nr:D-alanyl-D-alanine carboxypeptidase [Vineibacter terrae]HEX2891324.1 D-alanyl-D-alanine carboxypeptidase [Vineibacter terrae]
MDSNVLSGAGRLPLAFATMTVVLALPLLALSSAQAWAHGKFSAYAIDTTSGRVLYERNGNARRYPASLTKMMTLYLLFEDMERKRVSAASRFVVSRHAAAQPPSKLGLRPGQFITALDAIRALVTLSANDVAVVVAENRSGSEAAFAARMTRTARLLGMEHTSFRNASGLPDKRQYTTARDMALLGAALQARFPDYYHHFETSSFTHRGRTYRTHNHLLSRVDGVDGIKTGYIDASGYNIAVSLRRDARKIVAVVMGGRTVKSRDAYAAALVERVLPQAQPGRGYYARLLASIRRASPPAGSLQVARRASPGPRLSMSSYAIQLGAMTTKHAALSLIERAQPYVLEVTKDAEPSTQRVDVGGETLFRARFEGFANLASAHEACSRLEANRFSCFATIR